MKSCVHKILFFHGLDSSKESTNFQAIDADHKFCIDVDYRNLNYGTVHAFYQESIEKIKPDILVGHSLGAYWALKMSQQFNLPTVIANPSLSPNFRDDYPPIEDHELNHDILQFAYLELGDEILDMHSICNCLESYMQVQTLAGGHHRLAEPENINNLIHQVDAYLCQH